MIKGGAPPTVGSAFFVSGSRRTDDQIGQPDDQDEDQGKDDECGGPAPCRGCGGALLLAGQTFAFLLGLTDNLQFFRC